jgi:tetratricopeptide (TPR) repeat protein
VIGKEEKKEKQVEPSQIVTRSDSSHMVQSLVDRGYMALEDSKWDEADGFFEQALNQDSRCAKAYLGKMLRERQLTGVAEMIKRATSIDDIGSVQEQVRLDYDNEIIKAAIEQYVVPGYLDAVAIKKSFLVNVDYQSKVSKLEEKCRGIKEDFDSDKNYARALQFATEGETDEFQNIEKTIYDFYASEIEKEKQRDAASIERINKEYEEKLNQEGAKELYQQACLRKEKDYQAICDRMENLKKENSLPKTQLQAWSSLANSFEEFKDYKDSEKKRDYCIEKKKEYEIRVQKELKRERTKFIRNTCKIGIACLMCLFSVGMEIYGVSLRVTIDVIVAIAFCIVLKSLKKKGQEIIAIPIATALVTGIMLLDWDGKPAVLVLQVLLSIMCVIWLLVLYDNAISPAWENEKRMPTIILFAITVVIALVSFAVPKILVGELTDNTKMVTALIRIPFLMTCVVMLYDKWVAEMLKQYSIKFDIIAGVCGMAVVCLMVGMTGFVNAMFIAGIVLIGMTPV